MQRNTSQVNELYKLLLCWNKTKQNNYTITGEIRMPLVWHSQMTVYVSDTKPRFTDACTHTLTCVHMTVICQSWQQKRPTIMPPVPPPPPVHCRVYTCNGTVLKHVKRLSPARQNDAPAHARYAWQLWYSSIVDPRSIDSRATPMSPPQISPVFVILAQSIQIKFALLTEGASWHYRAWQSAYRDTNRWLCVRLELSQ